MRIKQYESREQQAIALAEQVASCLQQAFQADGVMRLAVPGGTTPAPFMRALSQQDLDWEALLITLTDERQVPFSHERSNALLLEQNFLQYVQGAQFIPLFHEGQAQGGIQQVNADLRADGLPLSSCVLGMGTDGHFASLFPSAEQLEEGLDTHNPAAALVVTGQDLPEPRVSLSLSALLSAPELHLLISGAEKLQVIEQAQANIEADHARRLPVEALLRAAGKKLTIHYAP